MADHIRALIREAEGWRLAHICAGRMIEAAGTAIRLKALRDALEGERHG